VKREVEREVDTTTAADARGPHAGTPADEATDADEAAVATLTALRASIDNLDAAIVHLLAERFKCTQKVGALKAAHGMPASDPQREARQIERLHRLARDADLDPVFAERFLNFVIEEVIRHHRALAEGVSR
jgi:chorismate mutase